jgi:hypothetical protein
MTVEALCDRQLETIKHQALKTVQRKTLILQRVRHHWKDTDMSRVKQSEVRSWLAGLKLVAPAYNLHLQGIKALFRQAVDDRLLATSPVDGIKQCRLARPIRITPTLEEFDAVVESISSQKLSDTAQESADYVEFLGLRPPPSARPDWSLWGKYRPWPTRFSRIAN